jgi:hypothetical protein
LQSFEVCWRQAAGVVQLLRLEEAGVDLFANRAQMVQGRQRFGRLEVFGVVDGGFCPQSAPQFEVLLDVGVLVADVQARRHAGGDDSGVVAARGGGVRAMRVGNSRLTRPGRPRSRVSRITVSKNCRPYSGALNTSVRLTSSCQMVSRWL